MPTSIIFLILNYFYLLNNQQIKLYCYKLRKKHTIWLRYLAPLFGSTFLKGGFLKGGFTLVCSSRRTDRSPADSCHCPTFPQRHSHPRTTRREYPPLKWRHFPSVPLLAYSHY